MTITEFLAARLGADEAAAHAAADVLADGYPGDQSWSSTEAMRLADTHIARHDPARVLAQVVAMRAIVAEHGARTTDYLDAPPEQSCRRCGKPDEYPVPYPCPTLRLLASVWSGHDDYDPVWAPDAHT